MVLSDVHLSSTILKVASYFERTGKHVGHIPVVDLLAEVPELVPASATAGLGAADYANTDLSLFH